jgi:para-aminobenzoate synthetase
LQYMRVLVPAVQALYNGDSYEVCLTTRLSRRGAPDAARLYRSLRRINPAPYAAWLRFGPGVLQLCCCSPERFLRGDRGGQLEAKPIKGTAPRSADPQQDQRSAAELAGKLAGSGLALGHGFELCGAESETEREAKRCQHCPGLC